VESLRVAGAYLQVRYILPSAVIGPGMRSLFIMHFLQVLEVKAHKWARVCLSVCCLYVSLRNYWMDFDEIWCWEVY